MKKTYKMFAVENARSGRDFRYEDDDENEKLRYDAVSENGGKLVGWEYRPPVE